MTHINVHKRLKRAQQVKVIYTVVAVCFNCLCDMFVYLVCLS